eukprot:15249887-Ditylum_brightwellii.AAC.1
MAAGVSREHYESIEDCPLFEENQGIGILMFSVCKKLKAKKIADAYVDKVNNTSVNEKRNKEETPTTTREGIKKIPQMWESLIFGLGG